MMRNNHGPLMQTLGDLEAWIRYVVSVVGRRTSLTRRLRTEETRRRGKNPQHEDLNVEKLTKAKNESQRDRDRRALGLYFMCISSAFSASDYSSRD